MALERRPKQPGDTQDFDVDYSAYLSALSDTGASYTVTVADGITKTDDDLTTSTDRHEVAGIVNSVVKVWLAGGTSGTNYKVTTRLTTTAGRVKEYEFLIAVKEL